MYLKELTISGFKSFAKKSDLEFSSQITAIVGPNGSGKSNVAEAFRFVLGEQSIKSMRGKRGEDLIFNGSNNASRSNRASVKIVLNNEKKIFPIDFDEISVERTVHRDGNNEYSINGSRTRLRDVQELLAAANIGPSGHHIISQGESDRILSASLRERREMIEDALGLKVFQYKKAESEKKLKKTKENIEHVESLRKEVRPHLKFLERQVKKIERSLQLREKLSEFYKDYLKREDEYIAFHHDRLMRERTVPAAELEELASLLTKVKTTLSESEKDEKSNALMTLEEKIASLREKRQEALKESGRTEGQVSYLERTLQERARRRESEAAAPVPYDEVESIVHAVGKLALKAKGSEDISLLRRTIDDISEKLELFLRSVSSKSHHDAADEHDEAELVRLKREKASHDETLSLIDAEEKALREEYEELKRSIEAEQTESREAEREVFRIMGQQREVEGQLGNIDRELSALERDRNEFKRELQEAIALLGRSASEYFSYRILDGEREISRDEIAAEERQEQHERRRELEKMKIRLEELGGGSGGEILKEYNEVKERDDFLVHEIEDLNTSVAKLEELIVDLTEKLNEQFVAGIEKIDSEFDRFFVLMFGGGSASLKRVKPKVRKKKSEIDELTGEIPDEEEMEDEEGEEGIEIDVKPPNKRVRGLEMLSGGERALTSIALIFAMSQVNPPLFVVLDETDAALDEANSKRYGDMIESLAQRSQLILITHNRETMSRAGVLYGITMGVEGVSKLLSVKFDEAVAVAV